MRTRHGFTLLEVLLAVAVFLVALLALIPPILASMKLTSLAKERALVMQAAQEVLEEIHTLPLRQIPVEYAPGSDREWFHVAGLLPVGGRTDHGRVILLTDENDSSGDAVQLGLPGLDLDGDGIDGSAGLGTADITGSELRLLPVVVEVSWTGHAGRRTEKFYALYSERL